MLVLFETAAGLALFKLLDEKKLQNVENLLDELSTSDKATSIIKLIDFKQFKDSAQALESYIKFGKGKVSKTLKKLLKNRSGEVETLAVGEPKLGNAIKEDLGMKCVCNNAVQELMRGIREHIESFLSERKEEIATMNIALAHSLGRYKVKFNPEKIDTMIIQSIALLDDLDKELNNYIMRCREWYGWHFPELGKILQDNQAYVKCIKAIGMRTNAVNTDLSSILPPEMEEKVKQEAEMSMGTGVTKSDLNIINHLCDQIIELTEYRTNLAEYLKQRMTSLAPNLTALVGELVGARLLSHAGSLVNLAKYPSSTVQIIGAEKALFRALKTRKDTPKYGLIYHAHLVGQASSKAKGKMARKLAAKISLSTRVDALTDESNGATVGLEARAGLEAFLRSDQENAARKVKSRPVRHDTYQFKSEVHEYDDAADSTMRKATKRKFNSDNDDDDATAGPSGKSKRIKEEVEEPSETAEPRKKKKKRKGDEDVESSKQADEPVLSEKSDVQKEQVEVEKKKRKKKEVKQDEASMEESSKKVSKKQKKVSH